jgi:hypothetical protein
MHNMTRRSHRMQKCNFGGTYPAELFMGSVPVPTMHEK